MSEETINNEEESSNEKGADVKIIGEAFYNPYTFIPFPKNDEEIKRLHPTALSADESTKKLNLKSGVLKLKIKTLSPLMTCHPQPYKKKNGHQSFKALTIGNDVILPATGVRGAIRSLMTILAGTSLSYIDEGLWLTQGRDVNLGPSKKNKSLPTHPFLAKVVKPGNANKSGTIELGDTRLIHVKKLKSIDRKRPWGNKRQTKIKYTDTSTGEVWDVKLSGRPIKRNKKEGLFKGNGQKIKLSSSFWHEYICRHRHAGIQELKKDDLIWLQPVDNDCSKITQQKDIKSIQWARWGREGISMLSKLPYHMVPDSMKSDGKVDIVTNMFGQIPHKDNQNSAQAFASRVRPGNLVFFDAKNDLKIETLAPLSSPRPGCIAFYRDEADLDIIDKNSPLKGYKVYRNSLDRNKEAPWKFSIQGVYKEKGELDIPQKRVNKTAELLKEGLTGELKISFRSLNKEELSWLAAICTVDWKLGGGKPLGLGHCRVISATILNEDGEEEGFVFNNSKDCNLQLKDCDAKHLTQQQKQRIKLYKASQKPVNKLRYPRAVKRNNNKNVRAGHSWFSRHAIPKKNNNASGGLETIWTKDELRDEINNKQIKAQSLPNLNADDAKADLLYGYDMITTEEKNKKTNKNEVSKIELFEVSKHTSPNEKAGKNMSQNKKTRQKNRDDR